MDKKYTVNTGIMARISPPADLSKSPGLDLNFAFIDECYFDFKKHQEFREKKDREFLENFCNEHFYYDKNGKLQWKNKE